MPFTFTKLTIPEVLLIDPRVIDDTRGFFMETYKRSEFAGVGIDEAFLQSSQSRSNRGVLRGLHYQKPPYAQSKLIRVLNGEVFDVVVDLRPDSPTAGRWVGLTLNAATPRILYVPGWCAHGFCVLSEAADVSYMASTEYAPEHESGIMWNDPAIGIKWPITSPTLSERDTKWPSFARTG